MTPSLNLFDNHIYTIGIHNGVAAIVEFQTGRLISREDAAELQATCEEYLAAYTDDAIETENLIQEGMRQRLREVREVLPQEDGFVYAMVNDRNGLTKIGYAKDPSFRERTLQGEEPEVHILAKSKGTRFREKALHKLFAKFRVRGEWFRLNEDQKLAVCLTITG